MVSWWPFHRGGSSAAASADKDGGGGGGGGDGVVPLPRSVLETEFYDGVTSGKDRSYGDSGVAVSQFDRMRDEQKIRRHGDGRAAAMDVESIDALVGRFENEFREADAHMHTRVAQKPLLRRYDYENDRRYVQWSTEQEEMRERLQIHWLDWMIDQPLDCLVYFLRVCTTAGLCFGAGRTAYLYRTMDKTYAKLNGVTLSSIAFHELTSSVAKGGVVAMAGTCGLSCGDVVTNLLMVLTTGDITAPQRTWWHIANAGTLSGALGGAAYVGLNYKQLTPWGMRAILGLFTATGAAVGSYLGYAVYRPYAAQRVHGLYDPHWRPWHTRHQRGSGPANVRGRYM
ncbi:hypothetical protein NESM_000752800 [Novymonas esmeraldas]|uniref:Uncharacterized protein n=1 Tax=Novymonas esmeraldas TaxID=1808958 RepID=A0AAW0EV73_9TRYP